MANLNKVLLIGRLGRDPEVRTFANGGKVANFSIAANNRKKNASTGQWEDDPCWLDCAAFNRGEHGKTSDLVEQYLRKGSQAFIEGHLVLEKWKGKDGSDKQKIKVIVDNVQFLDPKRDGEQPVQQPATAHRAGYAPSQDNDELPPPPPFRGDSQIHF